MQDAPPAKASAAVEKKAKKARELFALPNSTLPRDIRKLVRWTPARGKALYEHLKENLPPMDLAQALLERDRVVHPNMQAYPRQAEHTVSELTRLKAAGGDEKPVVVFFAASGGDGPRRLREELERSGTLAVDGVTMRCCDILPGQDNSSNPTVDGLDGHVRPDGLDGTQVPNLATSRSKVRNSASMLSGSSSVDISSADATTRHVGHGLVSPSFSSHAAHTAWPHGATTNREGASRHTTQSSSAVANAPAPSGL